MRVTRDADDIPARLLVSADTPNQRLTNGVSIRPQVPRRRLGDDHACRGMHNRKTGGPKVPGVTIVASRCAARRTVLSRKQQADRHIVTAEPRIGGEPDGRYAGNGADLIDEPPLKRGDVAPLVTKAEETATTRLITPRR